MEVIVYVHCIFEALSFAEVSNGNLWNRGRVAGDGKGEKASLVVLRVLYVSLSPIPRHALSWLRAC